MTLRELLPRLSPPMFEHEWRRLNPNQRRWLLLLLKLVNQCPPVEEPGG
jgi:hypothetical protein